MLIDPVVEEESKQAQETAQWYKFSIQEGEPHEFENLWVLFAHIIPVILHHLVCLLLSHEGPINFLPFPAFVYVEWMDPQYQRDQQCNDKEHKALFLNETQMMSVKVLIPNSFNDEGHESCGEKDGSSVLDGKWKVLLVFIAVLLLVDNEAEDLLKKNLIEEDNANKRDDDYQ